MTIISQHDTDQIRIKVLQEKIKLLEIEIQERDKTLAEMYKLAEDSKELLAELIGEK